jgi:dGTPase
VSEFILRTRIDTEVAEASNLAPAATHSAASRGRLIPEPDDEWRTPFEVDRDRIIYAKAFRRLKHKTQVFMNPEGDHYVTRLTHTLKVTQIGRAIARHLSLNETLTEAICLGHDVGHSPFGHTGEEALSDFVEGEWLHSEQSVRIFEVLEPINPSWEVIDGIRAHSWRIDEGPATPEGMIVRYADRIAYLAHDAEDAMRAGVLRPDQFPGEAVTAFGEPGQAWIRTMIAAVIEESMQTGEVTMDPDLLAVMHELRAFMFEHVYLRADIEPQRARAREVVRDLVNYYLANPEDSPVTYRQGDASLRTQVVDHVAGMTDRYALRMHDRLFRPRLFD